MDDYLLFASKAVLQAVFATGRFEVQGQPGVRSTEEVPVWVDPSLESCLAWNELEALEEPGILRDIVSGCVFNIRDQVEPDAYDRVIIPEVG